MRASTKTRLAMLLGALLISVAFFAVTYLGWVTKEQRIQLLMQWSLIVGVALLWTLRVRMPGIDFVLAAILLAGIIMRLGYAAYTPTTLRFHDLAPIDVRATGHAGYVLNLYQNGTLPTSNQFQFATPPLYYLLSALCMKVYALISGISNPVELFEAARLPSLLASCGALLCAYRIGKELQLHRFGMIMLLGICAFLPNHYLLAGRANPDGLAVFFIFWIVLYALRWQKAQTFANTVMLALGFGLGMMSKLTVAVLALPVGVMMLCIAWQRCVRDRAWRWLVSIALFALIALPLGLWFPIRNALLYGQPLGYVYDMGAAHPQYIGDLALWHRFGIPDLHALLSPLYIDLSGSANMALYTLKSAVFGEFSYDIDPLIPYILMLSNAALVLLSLPATVVVAHRGVTRREARPLLLVGMWLSVLGAYVLFNIRYPFYCSMDFRYMVGTSLLGALMLGWADAMLPSSLPVRTLYRGLTIGALIAFGASSVVMFTHIV
ncbi:MAG: glycosyltransferase family 39 protein [Candidatus Limiplasma sp.]|nr:glycosyltransferase family 39 protein [Candidatus Limiplasma sp.]